MYNYIPLSMSGECPELPKRSLAKQGWGGKEGRQSHAHVDETTEHAAGTEGPSTLIPPALQANNFI